VFKGLMLFSDQVKGGQKVGIRVINEEIKKHEQFSYKVTC